MSTLEIKDLYAHVETKDGIKPILKGVNLTVNSGETHAIMGPNGSGKSTLAYTLAGHPKYIVDSGQVLLDGENILKMTPDERAKAGIFLAMQYPVEVPGVSMTNFLRTAKTEVDGKAPAIRTWTKELSEAMKRLKMDPKFATRSVNEGFSGGEKKRAEVLQLELLKPKFAILDETDSGLDVDALRIVSEGVNRAKEANQFGILMVTHYTRILRYIKPDITCSLTATSSRPAVRNSPTSLRRPATTHTCRKAPIRKAHWHDRFRSDPQPISDFRPGNPRPSAGIPRFRRDIAEAAVRDRRGIGLLPHHQRRSAPRRA